MARHRTHPLAFLFLCAAACVFAVPLVWMVLSSLKPPEQLLEAPQALLPPSTAADDAGTLARWNPVQRDWRFENYAQAVGSMPFARYLRNSLILCLGSVVGTLASCSLVAYGFARIRWRGRNVLFGVMIATMLLPWHVTMVPRFLLLRELGLYNTLAALIVPAFLGDAFYIFLLRQFFLGLPQELSDAARLDGCSDWGIFWRIVLPLSTPALATIALFQFIVTWNDFNGPLLYLNDPDRFPLAYGMERFISSYSSDIHLLLAAATLFTVPVVVLFFFTQRTFLKGIATTGLKDL